MTLTEFLLARIAEDEYAIDIRAGIGVDYWTDAEQAAVERVSPARVLAECEAKRRIVAEHPWDEYDICTSNDAMGHLEPIDSCPVLRLLALPYADHPDYDERWKP